jgi:hypothetical protein
MFSLPGDGLQNYPKAGDTITAWVLSEGGVGDTYLAYGVQDNLESYYWANIDFTNQTVYLFKNEKGDYTSIGNTGQINIQPDTWYYLTIRWGTEGEHEIYLYDKEENMVGELYAEDSEYTKGGIGFITYPGDSSEKFYWDYLLRGEPSDQHSGGWGAEKYPHRFKAENGPSADIYENYEYFFDYNGIYDPDGSHYFAVGGFFHHYGIVEDYSDSQQLQPSDLLYNKGIDRVELNVELTQPDGTKPPSSYKGGNELLLNRVGNLTHYLYAGKSKWNNWVENDLHDKMSRDDVRDRAINEGLIDGGDNEDPWLDVVGLGLGAATIVFSGGVGSLASVASYALGGYSLMNNLTDEACGASDGNQKYYSDNIVLDPCDPAPNRLGFISYIATYRIDYSDLSEPLNLHVTQDVHSDDPATGPILASREWNWEIPGSGKMQPGNHTFTRTQK